MVFREKSSLQRSNTLTMSFAEADAKQPAVAALAFTGAAETAYLTYSKLSDNPVLCSSSGSSCEAVLSSAFSNLPVVDIPLSALAMVGYFAVIFMSQSKSNSHGTALLALTTSMATFSGYLMWVLLFVLKVPCYYCYASAAISFSLALLVGNAKEELIGDRTKAFVTQWTSVGTTLASSVFLFYTTSILAVSPDEALASTAPAYQAMLTEDEKNTPKDNSPPIITSKSPAAALALAPRLEKADAKMYGAYWCSHCNNQKKELGVEAGRSFPYIECDKEGKNSQYPLCKSKKIPGYPTWELYGEFFPGEKSLPELEKLLAQQETKHP